MPIDPEVYQRKRDGLTSEIDAGLATAERHERERAEALKYVETKSKQRDELDGMAREAKLIP